eukprot:14936791-Alexandrium_andersonii.AAC.1
MSPAPGPSAVESTRNDTSVESLESELEGEFLAPEHRSVRPKCARCVLQPESNHGRVTAVLGDHGT